MNYHFKIKLTSVKWLNSHSVYINFWLEYCFTEKYEMCSALFELWFEYMIYFCSINRWCQFGWLLSFDLSISKIYLPLFCSLLFLMLFNPYLFMLSSCIFLLHLFLCLLWGWYSGCAVYIQCVKQWDWYTATP